MFKRVLFIIFNLFVVCGLSHGEVNAPNTPDKESFTVGVEFYSVCCGINLKARDSLSAYLENYQKNNNIKLDIQTFYWGKEGELTVGLKLDALSEDVQKEIVLGLRNVLKNEKQIIIREHPEMPPYFFEERF